MVLLNSILGMLPIAFGTQLTEEGPDTFQTMLLVSKKKEDKMDKRGGGGGILIILVERYLILSL